MIDESEPAEAIHLFNPFLLNPRTYVRTYMGFQTHDMPRHQPVHISWKSLLNAAGVTASYITDAPISRRRDTPKE